MCGSVGLAGELVFFARDEIKEAENVHRHFTLYIFAITRFETWINAYYSTQLLCVSIPDAHTLACLPRRHIFTGPPFHQDLPEGHPDPLGARAHPSLPD